MADEQTYPYAAAPGYAVPPSYPMPGYAGYGTYQMRGLPPAVWPVVVFTFLFGILGIISAARRAGKAQAMGAPSGRYWGTFAGTLVGSWVLWVVIYVMLAAAAAGMTPA